MGVACSGAHSFFPGPIVPAAHAHAACAASSPSPLPSPVASAVAAALQIASAQHVPGLAIGIAYGGARYQYYWGYADVARGRCADSATVFEIGSLTKTFTAALLAAAFDEHKLAPNQNPSRFVDVLGQGNAVGPRCAPAPRVTPVPPSHYGVMRTMTLAMLATFTSGLPDDPFPINDLRERPCYSPDEFVRFVETYPGASPAPTPPHPWLYSNAGYGAIGYALQGAYGMPWIDQIQRRILTPLGMTHTYGQSNVPKAGYAQGYDCDGSKPVIRWPLNAWPAAGSLRSTLPDMLAYLSAAMQQPGTPGSLARAMKLAQTPSGVLTPSGAEQAFAWSIDANDAFPVIEKDGTTNGFDSFIAMIPPSSGTPQTGVVVLVNRAGTAILPTPPPCAGTTVDGIPAVQIGLAALQALPR